MKMTRHIYYSTYLLAISAIVYIPGRCADTPESLLPSDNLLKGEPVDLTNKAILREEICNDDNKLCQNGGTCHWFSCDCPEDYTGDLCETPAWCTWGRCGYGDDVECVWDRSQREGECRCKKGNHLYRPKDRKCHECDCGAHGTCRVVDDAVLACECDKKYALKSSKCERCDCGPSSERCSFNSAGDQVCQCSEGAATRWSTCTTCDCGRHGKCSWDGGVKICDCEDGYRSFGGKCIETECNCGRYGYCYLDAYGKKVCTCDYGYAEKDGSCESCDCNYLLSKRTFGVNCSFVSGRKQCSCPPGFETGSEYCEDINECYTTRPCPSNTVCINKPGTYECECKDGFLPISSDAKLYGCRDIDECSASPCVYSVTRCVNSPGSYDCVCREGFYPSSGTAGSSYQPQYNFCYEVETQWRSATIALGVILSVAIISISCYIRKHAKSS